MNTHSFIIFDLAGTTVQDPNIVGSCFASALAKAGVHPTAAEINANMGTPKLIAIRKMIDQYESQADAEAVHERFRQLILDTYRTSPEIAEMPGTSEVFRELRTRGFRIAVNTGFDRETTDILLGRMGWGDLVDDSITSDEVAHGRPHPDMVFALCQRAGIDPKQTVKVGDTPADIGEGRSAGVGLVVAAGYGTHTLEELAGLNPDAMISSISELLLLDL